MKKGVYSREERVNKIIGYKKKIRKYRAMHPSNRAFKGRSLIAFKKPRIRGKFVSIGEYLKQVGAFQQLHPQFAQFLQMQVI